MDVPIQPILLLADSQLLFWRDEDGLFLNRVKDLLDRRSPDGEAPDSESPNSGSPDSGSPDSKSLKAAYIGASNGDKPEFYDLFLAAMQGIHIDACRMIPSEPSDEDLTFVDHADLILLAGGDTHLGWQTFEKNGLKQKIVERYYTGALLIGLSAGAVQLGLSGIRETPARTNGSEAGSQEESTLFDTFKLIPLLIDAHQEPDWDRLSQALPKLGDLIQGLGIPSGGGAFVHPDMTVEPIRRPMVELSMKNDEVRQSLIFPPDKDEPSEAGDEQPKEDEPKALQPIIVPNDEPTEAAEDTPPALRPIIIQNNEDS